MAKKFLPIAAVVGAVAGVIAGVLVAPKSGKETRADLKAKADELKLKAESEIDKAKASASDALEDAKNKIKKDSDK